MANLDCKTVFKIFLVLLIGMFLILVIQCIYIYVSYKVFSEKEAYYNWSIMPNPFYNEEGSLIL